MRYFPLALFVMLFAACGEKFLKELEVDLPDVESQMAVTATFGSTDTELQLFVGRTAGTLAPDTDDTPVRDATVVLLRDEVPVGTFAFADRDRPNEDGASLYYYLPTPDGLAPGTYTLEVDAPDFDPVRGSQTLPDTARIRDAVITPDGFVSTDGQRYDELTMRIDDVPGARSYYRLQVFTRVTEVFDPDGSGQLDTFTFSNPSFPVTNNPTLEEGFEAGLYFTDATFEDGTLNLRIGINRTISFSGGLEPGTTLDYVVLLDHLTQDYYNYARSVDAFRSARDNPFAEPVNIVGNLDGGPGIFGLSGRTSRFFELEE